MADAHTYRIPYRPEDAPRLGLVFNATAVFNEAAKQHGERAVRTLFDRLKKEGAIAADSVLYAKRIFGFHDARAVASDFGAARVDAVMIFNSGFPNGFVFPTLAMDPHLRSLPVIVSGAVEANDVVGSREWTTNSICGNDMNNHVAKYVGRPVRFLDGAPGSEEYESELRMLLNVCHAVKALAAEYHGRFGDGPGGFHSASGDQLLFLKTFGVTVQTVDLLRVKEVFDTMKTEGERGTETFAEADIRAVMEEMQAGRLNLLDDQSMLYRGARMYLALRAIIRAEGFGSVSLKCWPEIPGASLPLVPCLSGSWLLSKGDVTAFGCEADWPMAVVESMATRLSGRPAAFLDFVNWTAASEIVQLGHCGVGIGCCMEPTDPALLKKVKKEGVTPAFKKQVLSGEVPVTDALIEHGVSRQAGITSGPTHIGQFIYGKKTGLSLHKSIDGKLKMLVFTGESGPDTAKGLLYAATDVRVKNYRRLDHLKRSHGFPHHLAVAMGDISRELRELCDFYGIEYITPDE